MFRNYDWECPACKRVKEAIVEFPQGERPPKTQELHCDDCGKPQAFERLISLPAKYMQDRPIQAIVKGGKFDTAGYKRLPELPMMPMLPPEKIDDRQSRRQHLDAMREHFHAKEYKEAKKERAVRKAENKLKRQRANAIKRGENIDLRSCKLPGDPKNIAS